MPCIGFKCPKDNKPITFDNCIKTCSTRCISRRTASLFKKMSTRTLSGNSITQINLPTRMLYLMIKHDYYEEPRSFVDRTLGTLGHTKTDIDIEDGLTEERLALKIDGEEETQDFYGKFDSYENNELWDLKIVGAFKVKRALSDIRSLHDYTLQQNFYRILIENLLDKTLNGMYIEAWAKEPMGVLAKQHLNKITVFKLPHLSNWLIIKFIKLRQAKLREALEKNWAPRCHPRHLWDGRRCNYCTVRSYCEMMDIQLKEKK